MERKGGASASEGGGAELKAKTEGWSDNFETTGGDCRRGGWPVVSEAAAEEFELRAKGEGSGETRGGALNKSSD